MTPERIAELRRGNFVPQRSPLLDECLDALEAMQREIDGLLGLLIEPYVGFGPDTPPGGRDGFVITAERVGTPATVYDTREQAVAAVKKAMGEKR